MKWRLEHSRGMYLCIHICKRVHNSSVYSQLPPTGIASSLQPALYTDVSRRRPVIVSHMHISYTYTYTSTHPPTRTHTRARAHTHIQTLARARAHTRARTHTHTHTHTRARARAHTHTNTRVRAHTRAHKRAHARAHTHPFTHPPTHMAVLKLDSRVMICSSQCSDVASRLCGLRCMDFFSDAKQ